MMARWEGTAQQERRGESNLSRVAGRQPAAAFARGHRPKNNTYTYRFIVQDESFHAVHLCNFVLRPQHPLKVVPNGGHAIRARERRTSWAGCRRSHQMHYNWETRDQQKSKGSKAAPVTTMSFGGL